jgi:hypothetical protein
MHRFRMFRRGNNWFYSEDVLTRQQLSLRTKDRKEAQVLLSVKNATYRAPMLNLKMAKAYLQQTHPDHIARTWGDVLDRLIAGLQDETRRHHWERFRRSQPFVRLRPITLFYTEDVHFLRVLNHPCATRSTQQWLRRLRNYAMDMGWLLHWVLPKAAWPKVKRRPRRAITSAQHQRIITNEPDRERRQYYQMLWLSGGAQTDVAHFHSDCIDQPTQTIRFQRKKMRSRDGGHCRIPIGKEIQTFLKQFPAEGWFFPGIRSESSSQRAARFKALCCRLEISDITLHSYRYALAERALCAGMPEKAAMAYLGHKSRSGHYAYAKNATIVVNPLSYYEEQNRAKAPR